MCVRERMRNRKRQRCERETERECVANLIDVCERGERERMRNRQRKCERKNV